MGKVMVGTQRNKLKQTAPWVWEEPYLAAMREQNPLSLPERLVTAEKAILLRIEVLRDAPENLPELQALREALNSLYAREPKKSLALPQIVEDEAEYEARQRNWMKLISVAALAAIFSFATGWILARKSFRNDVKSTGNTSQPKGNVTNSDDSFASVRSVHVLDEPPPESSAPPQDDGASAPLPNGASPPNVAQTHAQPEADERFLGAPSAKDQGASSVNGRKPGIAESSLQGAIEGRPAQPAKNPAPQASITLPSQPKEGDNTIPPKAAPAVRAEPQASPPPSIEDQPKAIDAPRTPPAVKPSGSVTVSFSTYPSIRVPPELRSQAVGAKLQIGQVISRVDPIYPEDAELQHVEGIVKLHLIVGTDGSVKGIEGISGPPLLVPAAVSAVRQWRYQPTLLGGQPIETGQDLSIVFRLVKDAASAN